MLGMKQLQGLPGVACQAGGFGPPPAKQPKQAPSSSPRKRNDRIRQGTKAPTEDADSKQQDRMPGPRRVDYLDQAMQTSMRHMLNYDSSNVRAVPASVLLAEQALTNGLDTAGPSAASSLAASTAAAEPDAHESGAAAPGAQPKSKDTAKSKAVDPEVELARQQELAAQVDSLLGPEAPLAFADKLANIVKGITQEPQKDSKPDVNSAGPKADAFTADILNSLKGFSLKSKAAASQRKPSKSAQVQGSQQQDSGPSNASHTAGMLDVIEPVVLPPSTSPEGSGSQLTATSRDWVEAWKQQPAISSITAGLPKPRSTTSVLRPPPGSKGTPGQRLPASKHASSTPTPFQNKSGTPDASAGATVQQAGRLVEPADQAAVNQGDGLGSVLGADDLDEMVQAALQGFQDAAVTTPPGSSTESTSSSATQPGVAHMVGTESSNGTQPGMANMIGRSAEEVHRHEAVEGSSLSHLGTQQGVASGRQTHVGVGVAANGKGQQVQDADKGSTQGADTHIASAHAQDGQAGQQAAASDSSLHEETQQQVQQQAPGEAHSQVPQHAHHQVAQKEQEVQPHVPQAAAGTQQAVGTKQEIQPHVTQPAVGTPQEVKPHVQQHAQQQIQQQAPETLQVPAVWASDKAALEADVKSLQQEVYAVLCEKKDLVDQLLDVQAQHKAEVAALKSQHAQEVESLKAQLAAAQAAASSSTGSQIAGNNSSTPGVGDSAAMQVPAANAVQVAEVANTLIGKVFASSELGTQSKVEWGADLSRILQLLLASSKTA